MTTNKQTSPDIISYNKMWIKNSEQSALKFQLRQNKKLEINALIDTLPTNGPWNETFILQFNINWNTITEKYIELGIN